MCRAPTALASRSSPLREGSFRRNVRPRVFYGVLGGFVVQAVLGGLGALVASKIEPSSPPASSRWCLVVSLAAASLGVIALATLDWIIGPW